MKTLTKLEASDIKFSQKDGTKGDPVHDFLMIQLLVGFVIGPGKYDPEDPMATMRLHVANFLNGAAESGIVITKSELPASFSDAFRQGAES